MFPRGELAMNYLYCTIICCVTFLLSACSPQVTSVKKNRYFWPPLPNPPKIEWIGTYTGSADITESKDSVLKSFIGVDAQKELERPLSVASDGKGVMVVSQTGKGSALRFDFNDKKVGSIADGTLDGTIQIIAGVTVDGGGNFYIADSAARKIFVVSAQNIATKVLNVEELVSSIGFIAFDKKRNRLIIPDPKSHKVVVTDQDGKLLVTIGGVKESTVGFNRPTAAAVESDGTIVVCDSFGALIQRFSPDGAFISKFGRRGDGPSDFSLIKGVAVDSEDHIYVTDGRGGKLIIFSKSGDPLLVVGDSKGQVPGKKLYIGGFNMPQGIYIDQNDRIFVADQLNQRVQVFQYMNQKYLEQNPVPEFKDSPAVVAPPAK